MDSFIILAGGSSRNLKKYGPISCLKYGSKTILQNQIDCIREYCPRASVVVVVGFQAKEIYDLDLDCDIVLNRNFERNNQSDSLSLGLSFVEDSNVWVIHGDVIFSKTAIKVPDKRKSYVFYEERNLIGDTKIGLTHSNGRLTNLAYGLPIKWGQVFYCPALFSSTLRDVCSEGKFTYEVINDYNGRVDVYTYTNKKTFLLEVDEEGKLK